MISALKNLGDRVSNYAGLIPFILMDLNIGGAIIMGNYMATGYEPKWLTCLDLINAQLADTGGINLLVLLVLSRKWKFISWVSYFSLCALWLLNSIYKVCSIDVNVYYGLVVSIIYGVFILLSVGRLTRVF